MRIEINCVLSHGATESDRQPATVSDALPIPHKGFAVDGTVATPHLFTGPHNTICRYGSTA